MAIIWKKLGFEDELILKSVLAAKGSLVTASAASTPTELAIGADGYILSVSTDTPAWINPSGLAVAAHATTHKNGGSDELLLHELGEPTGDVEMNGQEVNDMVIQKVANAAARPTAVVGKVCFQLDTLAFYGCTVDA